MKKVLFYTSYNQYETKRHFAKKFGEAFQRQGIEVSYSDQEDPNKKISFRPDLTLSFHVVKTLNPADRFLWDIQEIPHLSYLVDPVFYSTHLFNSKYGLISCVDRFDCEYAIQNGAKQAWFLPHAVEKDIVLSSDPKEYDIVFFGSCYDPDNLREYWQREYPKEVGVLIDEAAEMTLSDNCTPFYRALERVLEAHSLSKEEVDFHRLGYLVDYYIRGRDRLDLIKSIRDAHIHIFGGTCWRPEKPIKGWGSYLAKQPNVTLHPTVDYLGAMEILKKSRLSLNSVPSYKNGTHERIFLSLACGALPITTDNLYVREVFKDGEELQLYTYKNRAGINDMINSLLADEGKREAIVQAGRHNVMQHHTWDNRVTALLSGLKNIT